MEARLQRIESVVLALDAQKMSARRELMEAPPVTGEQDVADVEIREERRTLSARTIRENADA